jgi:group I intron endonuclease
LTRNELPGIYKIENLINRKTYIGSTKHLNSRWLSHRKLLRQNKHVNPHLQAAWNKDGEENFTFQVIEVVEDLSILNEIESKYIFHYKSNEKRHGYNLVPPRGSHVISEEWREKLRQREKHFLPCSDETKKKIGDANRGKVPWNKGKSFPPESHHMFGKKQSESTVAKISATLSSTFKKKWAEDEDYRKRTTESRKGDRNPMSNKNRTKRMKKHMSEINSGSNNPMFGKHPTEETRKKSSESHKAAWARRKAHEHS